jgi:CheY-like chemotaxis protein
MRILYVEDNPANLFLVQRVARIGNHEIINYTDGQSALDHFVVDKPDLVLMDVQLPGLLTGLDVVKALRIAGHRVPIIAVTAYAMMGDKERCLEAGCDGYMAKPMPVNDLVDIIKRYDTGTNSKPAVEPTFSAEKPSSEQAQTTPSTPIEKAETTAIADTPVEKPSSEQAATTILSTPTEKMEVVVAVSESAEKPVGDSAAAAPSPTPLPVSQPVQQSVGQADSEKKLELP